jgi:SOS response regulatory protein OraA/RecX
MFNFFRKNNDRDEEELLQRAMGQLYYNDKAREQIRRRLRGRDISEMDEADIYELVNEVISNMRGRGFAT